LITLVAAFVISACALGAAATPAPEQLQGSRSLTDPNAAGAPSMTDNAQTVVSAEAVAVNRLVIQNADVAIVVADVKARTKLIEALAVKLGGHVVSSSQFQTSVYNSGQSVNVPEAQMTIRVPSDQLDAALAAIEDGAVEVQSESRSGQDVTAEYIDQQSTLKNLEATEAQLTKILESATTTQDVLDVFDQLTSIRGQIEVVKGQIKYYEESAAMSAINIHIVAEQTVQPIVIAGWKPEGVARDAIQDLIYFTQGFISWLIRFVLFTLPALILIGIPLYLVFLGLRAIIRKFRKTKIKPEVEVKK